MAPQRKHDPIMIQSFLTLAECGFEYTAIGRAYGETKGVVAGLLYRNKNNLNKEKIKMDKHPSYGYATPQEIELLKSADGGKDTYAKQKLIEEIKKRGREWGKKKETIYIAYISI